MSGVRRGAITRSGWEARGFQVAEVGDPRPVSEDHSAFHDRVSADVTMASENGLSNDRVLTDSAIGPDDGVFDDGVFVDVTLAANHAIGAETGARLHNRALVNETGAIDRHPCFDARARRDEVLGPLAAVTAVEDIAMDLYVFLRRSDVNPVAIVDVGHEGFPSLDQRRKV